MKSEQPTDRKGHGSGFSFRPQQPGESDEEYRQLMARARAKFAAKSGRAKAVKGMLANKMVTTHIPPEDPPTTTGEPMKMK